MFKIVAGDFDKEVRLHDLMGELVLERYKGWERQIIVDLNKDVERIELMTEEKAKSFIGAAGLGLVGGVLLGPLGLLAGVLAGGNKKQVCFACHLKDGRKFMAVSDPKTYQKFAALAF